MDNAFWQGKRVFITGHTGFKGSWLSLWLRELGAEVTGFALPPPTTPALFEIARIGDSIESIIGDIRDSKSLENAIRHANPEIIFHLAAQPLVRFSYENPVETYATNVMGLVHLFEAIRKSNKVRAVINVTSDKCYENKEWLWGYRENEALGGHDPYSSSKGCAELVTAAYKNSYFPPARHAEHGVGIATARAGNVIGGGDWATDRLIPDILLGLSENRAVPIRNPHAIRPWQHVLEPLSGYILLAEKLYRDGNNYSEAWNFGPDDQDAQPVQWIVEHLGKHWGDTTQWLVDKQPHPHEATYLKLDCSKSKARLEWHPKWSLSIALEKIADWHKAFLAGEDMQTVTQDQIAAFSAAMPLPR